MSDGASRGRCAGSDRPSRWRFLRRGALVGALALLAGVPAGCDDAGRGLTEGWVEQTAERNRQALLEAQREELPLPEDVPVHQHGLADLEPPDDFEAPLVEELVIAERGADDAYLFESLGRAGTSLFRAVAVDDAGRIYVLDRDVPEVRVFSPNGDFLRRFGRIGEGPGDLMRPRGVSLAGDRLLIFHRYLQTSVWTPEGEFIDEHPTLMGVDEESLIADGAHPDERLDRGASPGEGRGEAPRPVDERERFRRPTGALGLPDGSSIATFRVRAGRRRGRVVTRSLQIFSRFRDGEETVRYLAVPNWARASAAASPRGDLYVSLFGHLRTEHFIVALAPDGTPRWMMINAWSPDRAPQVDLRVDGHGRLWAFPWVPMKEEEEEREGATGDRPGAGGSARDNLRARRPAPERPAPPLPRPAWVFSPQGELLAAGMLERRPLHWNWQVATGEHVYGIRRNAEVLGEWEVVRYRLVGPSF